MAYIRKRGLKVKGHATLKAIECVDNCRAFLQPEFIA